MSSNYSEITEAEAKEIYRKGGKVFVTTDRRTHWKIPASYEFGSHAPAEELFNRAIPKYEGQVKYYKA